MTRTAGALLLLATLLAVTPAALATTLDVTTTADSGPGSYRAAIEAVNKTLCWPRDPCTIRFAIPGPVPPAGWFTIAPSSPLPAFTWKDNVTIDGQTQTLLTGDTNPLGPEIELDGTNAGFSSGIKFQRITDSAIRGIAVNRFAAHGISIADSGRIEIGAHPSWMLDRDSVYVGVDPTGRIARPNGMSGIAASNTSTLTILQNVVAGNLGNGVYVRGGRGIELRNNRIGVGPDLRPLPNGANGVHFSTETADVYSNVIASNASFGIVTDDPGGRITMRANRIYDNGLLNIGLGFDGPDENDPLDMDLGPNGRMNAPVLTGATSNAAWDSWRFNFSGTVTSKPNAVIEIDVYASPTRNALGHANAHVPIARGTIRADANGQARFSIPGTGASNGYLENAYGSRDAMWETIANGFITATATTWEGTSELSAPIAIVPQGVIQVSTVRDGVAGSLRDAIETANRTGCTAEHQCWIAFRIPAAELRDGVAVIEPSSPLPAIVNDFVRVDGYSQTWSVGDTNPLGPEVEIHGSGSLNAAGLRIGLPDRKVTNAAVNDLAVTGFGGTGIEVNATDVAGNPPGYKIAIYDVSVGVDALGKARGNAGDGIWIRGSRPLLVNTDTVITFGTIGANGGNGVRVNATGTVVGGVRIGVAPDGSAVPNAGAGVLVDRAAGVKITGATIAHNWGPGVVTTPGTSYVYVSSSIVGNGGLGIDRNADGPDGPSPETAMSRPTITAAAFDSTRGVTVVEGDLGTSRLPPSPYPGGSGNETQLDFFVSSALEPDGTAEGERPVNPMRAYMPLALTGSHFRAELSGDLRGWHLTATASYAFCWWEFGCAGIDTSEFSDPVQVK